MALHTTNPGDTKRQMNLAPFMEWSATQQYNVDDLVVSSSGVWKAKVTNRAQNPDENTFWTKVVGGGSSLSSGSGTFTLQGGTNPYGAQDLITGTLSTQGSGATGYGNFNALLALDSVINISSDDANYNVYTPLLSVAQVPSSATHAVFEVDGIWAAAVYDGGAVANNPIITGLVAWASNTASIGPFGIVQGNYLEADARADAFRATGATFNANSYSTATVPTLLGGDASVNANDSSIVTDGIGLQIRTITKAGGATLTNGYGLKIQDQTAASTNYAIYTGAGTIRLGSTHLNFPNLPSSNPNVLGALYMTTTARLLAVSSGP